MVKYYVTAIKVTSSILVRTCFIINTQGNREGFSLVGSRECRKGIHIENKKIVKLYNTYCNMRKIKNRDKKD